MQILLRRAISSSCRNQLLCMLSRRRISETRTCCTRRGLIVRRYITDYLHALRITLIQVWVSRSCDLALSDCLHIGRSDRCGVLCLSVPGDCCHASSIFHISRIGFCDACVLAGSIDPLQCVCGKSYGFSSTRLRLAARVLDFHCLHSFMEACNDIRTIQAEPLS